MFSVVEQKYLLELLKSERLKIRIANPQSSQFYRVMNLLFRNGLVFIKPINSSNRKTYKLTNYGRAVASMIAKHSNSEGYKKYAFGVDLYLK